jgi:subfamily B ATP-binding cassette protein MsbA
VVKAFQREDYERERFRRENQTYFEIYMKNARVESLSSPVMEMLGALGMGVILWFGGKDVVDHVWTAGAFFAFIGSALSLYQPVKNFSRSNATLQLAFSGAERMFQLMDERPTVVERPGAMDLPAFSKEIEFDQVGFCLSTRTPCPGRGQHHVFGGAKSWRWWGRPGRAKRRCPRSCSCVSTIPSRALFGWMVGTFAK